MYIRRDKKSRKGRDLTYLSIAHNVWESDGEGEGRTRPVVFAPLGLEEDVDLEVAEAVSAALERYLEARWEAAVRRNPAANKRDVVEAAAREFRPQVAPLRILSSRELGIRLLLEPVWEELGLRGMLEAFGTSHRIEFAFERVVFGMVLNRLVDPRSKAACNDWLEQHAYFPEWDDWAVHQFYRALDILHEHWEELEERLFEVLYERLPERDREMGLLLADTTTAYFASKHNDEEIAAIEAEWEAYDAGEGPKPVFRRPQVVNEPPLRMQGKNKDGHPGEPQVVLANLVTPSGLVLRHRIYPGNTNDQTVARDLIEDLDEPTEMLRLWVSDNGMVNAGLLEMLDGAGWGRLSAEAARKSKFARENILNQPGRYTQHPTKEHVSFRAFDVPGRALGQEEAELWVMARNAKQRGRQLKKIDRHLEQVKAALASQSKPPGHGKKVCAVAVHQSLKRYVKPGARDDGRYVLNQQAIRRERRLAGVRLYRSTRVAWTPEQLLDSYGTLQQVERTHREYKGPLRLRPCYHRADRRIRAHVMLTILACNCLRIVQMKAGRRFDEIREVFSGLKAQEVRAGRRRYWQRTELTEDQRTTLADVGQPLPPKTWQPGSTVL
jgi:transposase